MLEVKNLKHAYQKDTFAVDDVSFTINPGDVFAFIGPNGAGKSTVIKSITGIIDFTSGTILIGNEDIKKNPLKAKKNIAYVPDNPDIYLNISGMNFLNFVCDMYNIDLKTRTERIKHFSRLYQMENSLNKLIESYSHGMKQKLVLISAFVRRPKLLILDEPFVGLDPMATKITREAFIDLCHEGSSVFFSTHVLEVAEKLCNKVAVITKGKIIASGDMKTIKGDKSLEEVFFSLGSSNEDAQLIKD